jgi:ubiquitin
MDHDLQLFIKTLNGDTITIQANSTDKILTVKEKIQKKQDNLLPSHQRLLYGGKQLEDDKTLMDYNILSEATLHLVVRLKGGQTIYVKTLIGDVFTFEFDENQTIAEVKQKIEETENIPVNEQRLFFNNKQLADNKTLKEYKIEEEDTIQLVLRKR